MLYLTIAPETCEIKSVDSLIQEQGNDVQFIVDAVGEEFAKGGDVVKPTHALVGSNGTVYAYATDFETLEALKAGMKAFFDAYEDTKA